MNESLDDIVRRHWWPTVATLYRLTGDLASAEDAVQEACAAAVAQWPADGLPANPVGWLVRVARNRAIDATRREVRRPEKEGAAVRELMTDDDPHPTDSSDDMLSLMFLCCHPALDSASRIALTLRAVCGLSTADIAAGFLMSEPTMGKRLVRARRKIRDSGIPLRTPTGQEFDQRLPSVLRVIYVIFTQGHTASSGTALVRGELCDTAIELARQMVGLMPNEPEVAGLLALLLLTDARRAARTDEAGELVLLEDQDRSLWDTCMIAEGRSLVEAALRTGRPGPYQLYAAIAACHADAVDMASTDWQQIALLYQELLRYEPSPVVEANRAVAVAMSEGPAAGLVILDALQHHPQLTRWPQLHIARAELFRRGSRPEEARQAFQLALELEPAPATCAFVHRRLRELRDTEL